MTVSDAPTIVTPESDIESEFQEFATPYDSTDDPNARTHIVRPYENGHIYKPGMEARDIVNQARVLGLEVVALCGHKWVPKHNPEAHDSCDACFKIANELISNPHGRD